MYLQLFILLSGTDTKLRVCGKSSQVHFSLNHKTEAAKLLDMIIWNDNKISTELTDQQGWVRLIRHVYYMVFYMYITTYITSLVFYSLVNLSVKYVLYQIYRLICR